MNARQAEEKIYRTDTARQLVAALIESRDQTDIRHVFDYHQGGSKGFEIACQRLGIPKSDWEICDEEGRFLRARRHYRREIRCA
jgi:hypothetical protein